jgi:predicted RNase H-like HicB family nuclease
MTETLSLTVVYEPVEEGWVQATIEGLPGVVTAAPSLAEAKESIVDALREWLLAFGEGVVSTQPSPEALRAPIKIRLSA